jgi:hypothetical protein
MGCSPVVQTGGGGPDGIVIPQLLVTVLVAGFPEESITSAVKLNGPGAVGVPVIAPVAAFRLSTGGSEPEAIENVYGGAPPVATRLELYGTPTVPVLAEHANAKEETGQLSTAGVVPPLPLMLMLMVFSVVPVVRFIRVAVPVTLQLPGRLPKVPLAVTVVPTQQLVQMGS